MSRPNKNRNENQPLPGTEGVRPLVSVAQILARSSRVIREQDPPLVRIHASIAAMRERTEGTSWFELVDPLADPRQGSLQGKLHGSRRSQIEAGLGLPINSSIVGCTVTADIRLGLDRQGRLRATVHDIIEVRHGLEQLSAQILVEKLRDEGLLRQQAGHSAPKLIRHVAVICPANSDAQADVAVVLERLWGNWKIRVTWLPCRFEGAEAEAFIGAALDCVERFRGTDAVDLVLIVRGGGSPHALAWLDSESLARKIAACPIPIVSGIGHADNHGVLDALVWHAACTPTDAAQHVHRLIAGAMLRQSSEVHPPDGLLDTELPVSTTKREPLSKIQTEVAATTTVPGPGPKVATTSDIDGAADLFETEFSSERGEPIGGVPKDTVKVDPTLTWMGRNPDAASIIGSLPHEVVDHLVASAYPRAFGPKGRINSVDEAYETGAITLAFADGQVVVRVVMPDVMLQH